MNKHFETLAVAFVCAMFVLSMHQSCSDLSKKFNKQENKEVKKAQELKNDTINAFKLEQKVR